MAPVEHANELDAQFAALDLDDLTPEQQTLVKNFRTLDDQYLASKKEYEAKVLALEKEYRKTWISLIAERSSKLKSSADLNHFWVQTFSNCEALEEYIEEHDIPVLEYLQDVTAEHLDDDAPEKGFKIIFEFRPNPYFENTRITKTYFSCKVGRFADAEEIERIECDQINWKSGKNITVKVVQKKKKARRGAPAKFVTEEQSVRSFFRQFMRSIDPEDELSDMDSDEEEEELDDEEQAQKTEMIMNDDWETGMMMRDCIIPHAVRWFTGEAVSDVEDEDEEEEDDEDEERVPEDSDEDSDDSDSPVKAKKANGQGKDKEECKQQ